MAVNFYLNSRTDKLGDAPIRVSIAIGGVRLLTSVGYSINPSKWDSEKQRVKQGASNARGIIYGVINAHLNNIETQSTDFENRYLLEKFPVTPEIIKQNIRINRCTKQDAPVKEKTLFDHYTEFMKEVGVMNEWREGTYERYAALQNHLRAFSTTLSFEDLNEAGLSNFIIFLRETRNLRNSTISKQLGYLKWFLRWSTEKGYNKTLDFQTFRAKLKMVDNRVVFLTWEELMNVYNFQIPENKKYLDRVRDVFCFCCFTSLRYSDVNNLKRSDIKDGALHITTVKTSDSLTIELNKYSKAILDKYADIPFEDNKALPVISNQRMNDYIKELGKLCGLDQPCTITYYKGNARIEEIYPKYELMGTHTGRRTFICNAIMMGIPPQVVMKWTGHSDYKAMKPYIDIADQAKAIAMNKFNER